MKNPWLAESLASARCSVVIAALSLLAVPMASTAGQRALEDFTSRQGAWCVVATDEGIDCAASHYGTCDFDNGEFTLTFPLFWIEPKSGALALVDALGDLDAEGSLGTLVNGSVAESARPDGIANVKVVLHSSNAAMRAFSAQFEPVFGYSGSNGTETTLGEATLQVSFTNIAPGESLPDVNQLLYCPLPEQALDVLSIRARASGPLREAFGVPEGTPGRLEVIQTGLLGTSAIANPNSAVGADAYPAEKIVIRATGK